MSLHYYRDTGLHLVGVLAGNLPASTGTPETLAFRVGVHPVRPSGADHKNKMVTPYSASPDVGLRRRQVHDRSDLVVLPLLVAEIS